MARESSLTAILSGSPLAFYFYFIYLFILIFLIFLSHSVRTDGVRSPDESVSEGKYLPLFFYEGGGGCSCSVVILS